jgi:hypothetical protein
MRFAEDEILNVITDELANWGGEAVADMASDILGEECEYFEDEDCFLTAEDLTAAHIVAQVNAFVEDGEDAAKTLASVEQQSREVAAKSFDLARERLGLAKPGISDGPLVLTHMPPSNTPKLECETAVVPRKPKRKRSA